MMSQVKSQLPRWARSTARDGRRASTHAAATIARAATTAADAGARWFRGGPDRFAIFANHRHAPSRARGPVPVAVILAGAAVGIVVYLAVRDLESAAATR